MYIIGASTGRIYAPANVGPAQSRAKLSGANVEVFRRVKYPRSETSAHASAATWIPTRQHFNHFPAGWAWAMDTPFQCTKQIASHLGGTRYAMVMKWPARYGEGGEVRTQFTHVIDIAPTILMAAGINLVVTHNDIDVSGYALTSDDAVAAGEREL